jgi:Ca2+:H+ antiporter
VGLVLPAIYYYALEGRTDLGLGENEILNETLKISRVVAVILLVGYLIYVIFQTKSHDGLFAEIYEIDELKDADRHKDLRKPKLTLTESILALVIALACVSLIAVFLVDQIHYMVKERHVSDAFIGLILIPLVEKVAGRLSPIRSW